MQRSVKTRFLDFIRKGYANRFGEGILLRFSNQASATGLISKFIPMPYLFSSPSWRQVVRHGLKLNLDISDFVDWYVYFGLKDDALEALLSHISEDDCVLDIGTNIGYVALRCSKKAKNGKVHGFEPSSYNFKKAQENLALNPLVTNVSLNNIGLGSESGQLELTSSNDHNRGMTSFSSSGGGSKERVAVLKLDDWVNEKSLAKIDLIKLDVEGFELNVLRGAEQLVARFHPKLFIEVNDSFLRRSGGSSSQLFEFLKGHGYNIFDLAGDEIVDAGTLAMRHMDIIAIARK